MDKDFHPAHSKLAADWKKSAASRNSRAEHKIGLL